ncbi:DUF2147 domain-containing protein [Sneathiella sp.]|uniref:DUF2147 domain-containing protein n=1 Tax=Sneathiella sp. TaxID=1964365 RepID=UPI0026277C34|nr:DUF2147 domain-containing protein [Sneathiella sp.]MDF2368048.1 DUF2147 domain-containing protein [Sneathiella sp.]
MRKTFISISLLASLLFITSPARADITGVWSTVEGKSRVKIEPCGDKFCGKIVWLKEPQTVFKLDKTDMKNENPELRGRKILGLELLNGFEPDGENEWDDGTIYNPEDGKTYSSSLTLVNPTTLDVKGCVLMFCKTQTWTKVK